MFVALLAPFTCHSVLLSILRELHHDERCCFSSLRALCCQHGPRHVLLGSHCPRPLPLSLSTCSHRFFTSVFFQIDVPSYQRCRCTLAADTTKHEGDGLLRNLISFLSNKKRFPQFIFHETFATQQSLELHQPR